MQHRIGWLIAGAWLLAGTAVVAGPDKVVFPADYKASYKLVATRDAHLSGNTIAEIYANPVAVESGKKGFPLASGAVFLMEVYAAKLNEKNEPALDANGRFIKDQMRGINMMEKRTGWGAEYPPALRNGEWEFAAFTADAKLRDVSLTACFECHKALEEIDHAFAAIELRDAK